jgi:membrane-bound serine protease (ClpP class)
MRATLTKSGAVAQTPSLRVGWTLMKAASLRALVIVAGAIGMALSGGMPAAFGASSTVADVAATTEATVKPQAIVLEINGAIGPATSRYVVHGIESAQKAGSRLVILEVDTPGGLDTSMRDIIRAILASPVPVVTYVSPPGARAASAGTYILYASHIAAMAPATNLGAATPVSIGGEPPSEPNPTSTPEPAPNPTSAPNPPTAPSPSPPRDQKSSPHQPSHPQSTPSQPQPQSTPSSTQSPSPTDAPAGTDSPNPASPQPATAMERKVINDAVAYIRGLAELRGRNADWAEKAVRGAASLSSTAALQQKVIDVVARDIPDLLTQIDGREVKIGDHDVKLATRDLGVQRVKPDWRTELLAVITNPTVAYGLMLIGIYGLLLEGYNPGVMLPGVAGTICLLLALFAFQILSVNYAGLALVALGVGMIIAEFFFPTFGSLGLGGLIAFVVGSLILFDTDVPGMNIALPLITAFATVGGLVIVGIAYVAARSMRRPVVTGVQGMIGDNAEVIQDFAGTGRVRYRGELWSARSETELRAGQIARIVKVEGLTLWVEPR